MWQLKAFINFCGAHCSVAYGIGTVKGIATIEAIEAAVSYKILK